MTREELFAHIAEHPEQHHHTFEELDKLSRGRKSRPEGFYKVCEQLAETLREAMSARVDMDRKRGGG